MINVFYRISDQSYDKAKLLGATKQFCLNNFLYQFHDERITVLADNCNLDTIEWLWAQLKDPRYQKIKSVDGQPFVLQSALGNAGAVRKAVQLACELPDDDIVYTAEDDYLYRSDRCPELIEEGLSRADYVTLYDHPDKYESEYSYGEVSKVFKTNRTHWRQTVSTTMTFAARAKTLKQDLPIWLKYTEGPHPWDHMIFSELTHRMLAVCIPGRACHVDLTYSAAKHQLMIEDWAVDLVHDHFESQIEASAAHWEKYEKIAGLLPSMQKLAMMETILKTPPPCSYARSYMA